MPNFDYFWGLDQFLIELGLTELWHLTIVHAFFLAVFLIANVMIFSPLFRLINKKWLAVSKSFASAVLGFSIVWPIVFGVLLLLLENELSLARHLYVYFVLLVMFLVSQIHTDMAVSDYRGESEGGKIEERARAVHKH